MNTHTNIRYHENELDHIVSLMTEYNSNMTTYITTMNSLFSHLIRRYEHTTVLPPRPFSIPVQYRHFFQNLSQAQQSLHRPGTTGTSPIDEVSSHTDTTTSTETPTHTASQSPSHTYTSPVTRSARQSPPYTPPVMRGSPSLESNTSSLHRDVSSSYTQPQINRLFDIYLTRIAELLNTTSPQNENDVTISFSFMRELNEADTSDETEPTVTEEIYTTSTEIVPYTETLYDERICPISHEVFEEGEMITQIRVCRHIFKTSSIRHWLFRHPHCPTCRFNILTHFSPPSLSSENTNI